MIIKFTYTEDDFNGLVSTLKLLGQVNEKQAEELKAYWPQLADKELNGDELPAEDGQMPQIRFGLFMLAIGTVEEGGDQ